MMSNGKSQKGLKMKYYIQNDRSRDFEEEVHFLVTNHWQYSNTSFWQAVRRLEKRFGRKAIIIEFMLPKHLRVPH